MIVIWNRGFDRPRVEKAPGIRIPIEATEDTMDSFHVQYNAFRRRLGFASSLLPSCGAVPMWKHLSHTHPEFYSCMDAIALLRNHYDLVAQRKEAIQAAAMLVRLITELLTPKSLPHPPTLTERETNPLILKWER